MSSLPATNREKGLISFLRQLGQGEVRIRVENGQPVFVYEVIRNFCLEEDTGALKNFDENRYQSYSTNTNRVYKKSMAKG